MNILMFKWDNLDIFKVQVSILCYIDGRNGSLKITRFISLIFSAFIYSQIFYEISSNFLLSFVFSHVMLYIYY